MSTYDRLGIPTELSVILCCGALVLALAPYFAGVQLGGVTIPELSKGATRWLKILSPLFVVALFVMYVPLWAPGAPPESADQDDPDPPPLVACGDLVKPWTGDVPEESKYRVDLTVTATETGKRFTSHEMPDGGAFFVMGDEDQNGVADFFVVLRPFVQRGPGALAPSRPSICLEVSQYDPPGGIMEPLADMRLKRLAVLPLSRGDTRRIRSPDGDGELELSFDAIREPTSPASGFENLGT